MIFHRAPKRQKLSAGDLGPAWKPISFAPGYFVNEEIEVLGPSGWLLSPGLNNAGYLCLSLLVSGKRIRRPLHQLVCDAFHGQRPSPNHLAAHNDGNRLNNAPDNLRWALPVENSEDARRHGTLCVGERSHLSKLTTVQAAWILCEYRRLRAGNGGRCPDGALKVLAFLFDTTVWNVRQIGQRYSWRHLDGLLLARGLA